MSDIHHLEFYKFLPRVAYAVMRCVCVCLCVSVTFVDCVKTNKHSINIFYHRVATPFWFYRAKQHSNIPTVTPLMWTSNAGG